MEIRRSEFVRALGAAMLAPGSTWAGDRPLLKIGVMTDTHVGKTKTSCSRARLAYELFRDIGVDLIVNDGDVADHHYPTGYTAYREMVEETFAGVPAARRPKELFVYAWHDAFDYRNHPRGDAAKDAPEAFSAMQRLVKAPNGPYAEGEVNGYPYVVIPQFYENGTVDWKRFDRMLADAVAAHPGKPVFVFAHVPPEGTTRTGRGSAEKRMVLNRYPQVINISGHTHGSLRDERAIWQGEFTSVNAGCLQRWGGGLPGSAPREMEEHGVVLVEVFADRIVFRRFDVRDRSEYSAAAPWVVPWPFDSKTAPFRPSVCSAAAPVPAFASDAAISVTPDADPFKILTVSFPCVAGVVRPYAYRVELAQREESGTWVAFARRDLYGDFWQREVDRPSIVKQTFGAPFFEEGREYRITVTPRNSWGREGKGIERVFTAARPARDGKLVWESSDPMKECPFRNGLAGKTAYIAQDGFFTLEHAAQARLVFPDGVWSGPKGTRFRFTIDMRAMQGEGPCWTMVLRNRTPLENAVPRIATPPGDSGVQRYVLEFTKPNDAYSYALLVREGGAGRISFCHVKIEHIP
ncbi:MAG: metallophosphoesterase [Kiritimatiellae bacterium]|nr:metallophosphoesterase [Kiritimatiellia bacterium]